MQLATAAQMRECDRLTIETIGLPGIALMESAGRAAAHILVEAMTAAGIADRCSVGIYCGRGNNGGDGFVIARELLNRGCETHVYLLGSRAAYKGDAQTNLAVLEAVIKEMVTPGNCVIHPWGDGLADGGEISALIANAQAHQVVVDALLGTGLSNAVRSPALEVIEHIDSCDALVMSVDIPSGLSSDSGQPLGPCVCADLTATFGLAKVGQVLYPGRDKCGQLHVIDIGIAPGCHARAGINTEALTPDSCAHLVRSRPSMGHKGTFGHVLALGGARGKVGALMLCAKAALRTGAGLVTAAGSAAAVTQVSTAFPEVMTAAVLPDGAQEAEAVQRLPELSRGEVVAAGCGLGTSEAAEQLLEGLLLEPERPLVLDADALNIVAAGPGLDFLRRASSNERPVVLTPHPGEFARLTGSSVSEILRDAVGETRDFARATGCVVALKTASTVVAHPDGRVAINTTGNPGMATGGSGDVLTGVVAGLMAQGHGAWDACRLGVMVHGLAGDIAAQRHGERSVVAGDLVECLGEAFKRCELG